MRLGIDTTFVVQSLIREHPDHAAARREMDKRLAEGDTFVMSPQIVAEVVHVVTDPRRFERSLEMSVAQEKTRQWWEAKETERVYPTPETVDLFWSWMRDHRLGRKRLLDTMLAATYRTHGVETILSSNARDFTAFGCFEVIHPG